MSAIHCPTGCGVGTTGDGQHRRPNANSVTRHARMQRTDSQWQLDRDLSAHGKSLASPDVAMDIAV
ncbi:hypothetical protein HMPREF0063_10556 [Aeromicrobium marinum DSM 15272]|uniref:Uncharacterized protein n=1 Tax=Aeromicrobium marinum DSM 15272 TaxID=585531 RepID=E2S9B6_9ACTN|nr:hypothetical protein [Aeromicrobium marinum]EFQ83840.1 hypothetical protein HMPREF0063_10556 [Aeromicrobium marinum DSM 15272]